MDLLVLVKAGCDQITCQAYCGRPYSIMMDDPTNNEEGLEAEKTRRIAVLITGFICQSLKPMEEQELDEWVTANDQNMLLFEELTDPKMLLQDMNWMDVIDSRRMLKKIKGQLHFSGRIRSIRFLNRWWHYAVAASFVLVAGATGYFIYKIPGKPLHPIAQVHKQDVPPGGDRAILTLADGNTVVLEDVKDGVVATQGVGRVIKKDGMLEYTITDEKIPMSTVLYNTISTPRGGSYSLALSDGTKLWLNAASSVKFPAVFGNKERKVIVTGEVYFEVMKNKSLPFRVEVNGMEIEVLGTHFNINAYAEETGVETTLLEGSVKLINQNQAIFLKPGQKVHVDKTGKAAIHNNVDTEQMVAWKNGLFQFNEADIPTIMRQISRWYDVSVSYEGDIPGILTTGKAPRNTSLANLLRILALSGVHYRIENKNLTILP